MALGLKKKKGTFLAVRKKKGGGVCPRGRRKKKGKKGGEWTGHGADLLQTKEHSFGNRLSSKGKKKGGKGETPPHGLKKKKPFLLSREAVFRRKWGEGRTTRVVGGKEKEKWTELSSGRTTADPTPERKKKKGGKKWSAAPQWVNRKKKKKPS